MLCKSTYCGVRAVSLFQGKGKVKSSAKIIKTFQIKIVVTKSEVVFAKEMQKE